MLKVICCKYQLRRNRVINIKSVNTVYLLNVLSTVFLKPVMTLETEARRIRNYTIEEAVNFVLTPGSDSELSELSDDDELDTVDEVT